MSRLLIFTLLFPVCLAAQRELKPVAAFTFNEDNVEEIHGRLKAKMVGVNLTRDRFGNKDKAVYFQGNIEDYVNLGTDTLLKPRIGTISLWVKVEKDVQKGRGIKVNPFIITKCRPGNSFYEAYFISYDYENKRLSATNAIDSLTQISIYSRDTFSLCKWHQVAIAWDDHNFMVYIDGELDIKQGKNFRNRYLEGDSVVLGSCANTVNQRALNGALDDIYFFDRVLSEKEIQQLYNAPDPNTFRVAMKWAIWIGGGILFVALLLWTVSRFYKTKLDKQKDELQKQLRMLELENKAFKAQMNPHFIFNSLNTVQKLILQSKSEEAHEYVSKFAKLLRKILEGSAEDSLPLEDEIDILNSYLEMEQLRFDHSFQYRVRSKVTTPNVSIPSMLVQPFVENAIWHGLLPKKGERNVTVEFTESDGERIKCRIDDNGIGREQSSLKAGNRKKKSLAIEFIRQRLEVLSKSTGINCGLNIIDKKNDAGESTGTIVELTIPKLLDVTGNYH